MMSSISLYHHLYNVNLVSVSIINVIYLLIYLHYVNDILRTVAHFFFYSSLNHLEVNVD